MITESLLLFPADASAAPPSADALVAALRALGLVGERLADAGTFLPGAEFPRHVVFAGCSPHLVLDPPADGGAFSLVRIHGPHALPRLLVGDNVAAPRCPACRARVEGWREHVPGWVADPASPVACATCGRVQPASQLDWRASAAPGRLFIEVGNVFPGEAVPGEVLLEVLHGLANGPWRYAWLRGNEWRVAT